jgi:hypothetical protein
MIPVAAAALLKPAVFRPEAAAKIPRPLQFFPASEVKLATDGALRNEGTLKKCQKIKEACHFGLIRRSGSLAQQTLRRSVRSSAWTWPGMLAETRRDTSWIYSSEREIELP